MKHEYTQTEEIFFKMHWSYFTGQYKILNCKPWPTIPNPNNYFSLSQNLFGQFKNRNIYNNNLNTRKYHDLINGNYNKFNGKINYNNNNLNVIRSRSLNNRIIFSSKRPSQSTKNNINYNNQNKSINRNNIINSYYNKIINENKIQSNIINKENNNIVNNEELNNEFNKTNYKINITNNIKSIKEQNEINLNKKKVIGKNQFSTLVEKKPKKDTTNSYNKDNTKNIFNKSPIINPIQAKKKLTVNPKYNNNIYKIKNENENIIEVKEDKPKDNIFYITKSNGLLNQEKVYKENIRNKMAKSSTYFYKH